MRTHVQELLDYSNNEKKRNFLETVELQIGLKNYDPQRDKRFSGTVKLPSVPRPNMAICILGDQHDVSEPEPKTIPSERVETDSRHYDRSIVPSTVVSMPCPPMT